MGKRVPLNLRGERTEIKRESIEMLAFLRKAAPWVCVALINGVAVAQVALNPKVASSGSDSWTTVPAADGSQITVILDGDKRIISATGMPRGGSFLAVDVSYQPAGITFTFNGPVPGLLAVSVLHGTRAVYVNAGIANGESVSTLVLQWPCVPVPNLNLDLATYTVDSVPERSLNKYAQPTAALPGPMQAYLHAGNAIDNDFHAYALAAQYFAPVFTSIANSAPAANSGTPATSIVAKLESDQAVPPPKVCATADAANAFGLLVCIGVGIGNGAPSLVPDNMLSADGLSCDQAGVSNAPVKSCSQAAQGSSTSGVGDNCATPPSKQ